MRRAILFALVLGCTAPEESVSLVSLVVQATGLPDNPGTLHALVLLGGAAAKEVPSYDIAGRAGRRELSILLRLPTGSAGLVQVAVGVKDLDGCLTATGFAEGFLDGAQTNLPVRLDAISPQKPPCKADEVPAIASVTPTQLRTQEQSRIKVTGFGFQQGATLSIGGKPAQGVTWLSPLEMTALSPRAQPGPADIAITNPDGRTATGKALVRYNLTHLKFTATSFVAPGRMHSGAIGDVNGDGWPDLIWTDPVQAKIFVRMNQNGAFPEETVLGSLLGRQLGSLVVGDLNGDGRVDAVVGSEYGDISGDQNKLRVLLAQTDGPLPFRNVAVLDLPEHPDSPAIADLNGDGRQDIVVAATSGSPQGNGLLYVVLGRADGMFLPQAVLKFDVLAGMRPGSLSTGDWNGDGKIDLAVTSGTISSDVKGLRLFFNQGLGQVADPFLPGGLLLGLDPNSTRQTPVAVRAADLNADGRTDLLLSWLSPSLGTVLLNQGQGIFARDFGAAYPREGGVIIDGHGDFDGDGFPDLILPALGGNSVHILQNRGDGTFPTTLQPAFPSIEQVRTPQAADLNRDGRMDLVTFSSTGGVITVLMSEAE